MRPVTKGIDQDEVTYFFLIEDTTKGAGLSSSSRTREMGGINKVVRSAGGQCRLYMTRGSKPAYVSVITGISHATAIRIAEEIDAAGNVKATLVSGLELFGSSR